jgi:hypothetical protein
VLRMRVADVVHRFGVTVSAYGSRLETAKRTASPQLAVRVLWIANAHATSFSISTSPCAFLEHRITSLCGIVKLVMNNNKLIYIPYSGIVKAPSKRDVRDFAGVRPPLARLERHPAFPARADTLLGTWA